MLRTAKGLGAGGRAKPDTSQLFDVASLRHYADGFVLSGLEPLVDGHLSRERARDVLPGCGPDTLVLRNNHKRDAGIGDWVDRWLCRVSGQDGFSVAAAKGAAFK